MDSQAKTLESNYERVHNEWKIINNNKVVLPGNGNESQYTTFSKYDLPYKNAVPDPVANTGKVEGDAFVIQYGEDVSDFAGTQLDKSLSSYWDSSANKLKIPLSKLYLFPAIGKGVTLPKKKINIKTGADASVKGTFYTIDGSSATSEVPANIFKDRWGNVWIQLEGTDEFVPIEAGGSVYSADRKNVPKFQSAAQRNLVALKEAIGDEWTNTWEYFGLGSEITEDGR